MNDAAVEKRNQAIFLLPAETTPVAVLSLSLRHWSRYGRSFSSIIVNVLLPSPAAGDEALGQSGHKRELHRLPVARHGRDAAIIILWESAEEDNVDSLFAPFPAAAPMSLGCPLTRGTGSINRE